MTIPINVDRNISKKTYAAWEGTHLLVTRMFFTYQGEGPFVGTPAIFIRLAGCDIGSKEDCPFCDTAFQFAGGELLEVTQVEARVRQMLKQHPGVRVIVFTGGEPLLQYRSCVELANQLDDLYLEYQFETNGHLIPSLVDRFSPDLDVAKEVDKFGNEMVFGFVPKSSQSLTFVVSPKIPHGKGHESILPLLKKLSDVASSNSFASPMFVFKFVLEAGEGPYSQLPSELLDACKARAESCLLGTFLESVGLDVIVDRVYVSGMTVYKKRPEGFVSSIWDTDLIDHEKTAANYQYAAAYALAHPGLLVSFQTHLFGAVE